MQRTDQVLWYIPTCSFEVGYNQCREAYNGPKYYRGKERIILTPTWNTCDDCQNFIAGPLPQ